MRKHREGSTTIKIFDSKRGKAIARKVESEPTCTPLFVIHRRWRSDGERSNLWAVTHIPTGWAVNVGLEYDLARKVAAICSGLPLNWRESDPVKLQRRIKRFLGKLIGGPGGNPDPLYTWFEQIGAIGRQARLNEDSGDRA